MVFFDADQAETTGMVNALFFIYSWFIFVPLMLLATVVAGAVCLCLVPFLGPRRVARLSAVPWARW